MALKKRLNYNTDKLRQCYKQPHELFQKLSLYTTNNFIDFQDFKLHIIDDGRSDESEKEPIKIKANVILGDGTLLGEFVFNDSARYEGKCFFSYANSALYKVFTYNHDGKCNYQGFVSNVADTLGLTLNNFTQIEIAADVNFNPIPKIQKYIRDFENWDMIVNGKRVSDENRTIEGFGEYFERSRKKRNKYPTLYFKQVKDNSPLLRIYDKSNEINAQNTIKKYVEDWNEYGSAKVYRLEVSIKNEDFKKWIDFVHSADNGLLREWCDFYDPKASAEENAKTFLEATERLLGLRAYKCQLWRFFADRLVYFRSKRTSEVVSLLDIAEGRAN